MKHVTCFGMLYRLSDAKYAAMLRNAAEGKDIDPSRYGKVVGCIDLDVTDFTPEIAQSTLDSLRSRKRKAKGA